MSVMKDLTNLKDARHYILEYFGMKTVDFCDPPVEVGADNRSLLVFTPEPVAERWDVVPGESEGVRRIAYERDRQIHHEGRLAIHDDDYVRGQLAQAAACYAWPEPRPLLVKGAWPWPPAHWKPLPLEGWGLPGRVRELEKAGALIAAEIDRLCRVMNGGPRDRRDDVGSR